MSADDSREIDDRFEVGNVPILPSHAVAPQPRAPVIVLPHHVYQRERDGDPAPDRFDLSPGGRAFHAARALFDHIVAQFEARMRDRDPFSPIAHRHPGGAFEAELMRTAAGDPEGAARAIFRELEREIGRLPAITRDALDVAIESVEAELVTEGQIDVVTRDRLRAIGEALTRIGGSAR
jgi:hypothetical protein